MSRYHPDPNDLTALDSMTEEGRLHFFNPCRGVGRNLGVKQRGRVGDERP